MLAARLTYHGRTDEERELRLVENRLHMCLLTPPMIVGVNVVLSRVVEVVVVEERKTRETR